MVDFFQLLYESGLVTAAFIIGAITVVLAIVGSFKQVVELSGTSRFLLALFGLLLIALSVAGLIIGQTSPSQPGGATATPVVSVPPTSTPVPTSTQTAILTATPLPTSTPVSPSPTPSPGVITSASCTALGSLGPWPPTNGQGNEISIDASDSWIHADFWAPGRTLKEGYDEVSVLFEPGVRVTVLGVAGTGWKYPSGCTRESIEQHIRDHQAQRREQDDKTMTTISVGELCDLTDCRW